MSMQLGAHYGGVLEANNVACSYSPGGGAGVHDLWMDGSLPPGYQKATLFELPTVAVLPTFMMNFCGKIPIFTISCGFLKNPPVFKENLPKKGPLFRDFWTPKPIHMGGTYRYPQHVMLPHPPGFVSTTTTFLHVICCQNSKCCGLLTTSIFENTYKNSNMIMEIANNVKLKE